MNVKGFIVLLLVLSCQPLLAASEPDYAREGRLADEIVDVIFDGDPEWLEADGREFLSIYTEADDTRVGVIILHGRGFHPDWADAINPLRVGLADYGYSTLSLQMPVLEKSAKYYDYVPIFPFSHERINAGIEFLRDAGFEKVVLLAHSCGGHMAMSWIREFGDDSIDGLIGLGLGATDFKQPMTDSYPLGNIKVPFLDLYGEMEFPAVLRLAGERQQQVEGQMHPQSSQWVLEGSNHYFTDRGEELTEAVLEWLDSLGWK